MAPKVIEDYTECGVNAGAMINRMIRHMPTDVLMGINAIRIIDHGPANRGFALYRSDVGEIDIYAGDIICWQPWIFKKSYVFPYLSLGLALGHEVDHHVNRFNDNIDHEKSAEMNAFKYIYPSFGFLKPLAKLISIIIRICGRNRRIG